MREVKFSLVELMGAIAAMCLLIVMLIVGLVLALGYGYATKGDADKEAATQLAGEWSRNKGLVNPAIDCGTTTHGKEELVSCTVAVHTGAPIPTIYGLACPGNINLKGERRCLTTSEPILTPATVP